MEKSREVLTATAFEQPTSTIDLNTVTRAEILERIIELNKDRSSIKQQLREAAVRYHDEGVRSDPKWFSRAQFTLDLKARQIAQLSQVALPEVKKREQAATMLAKKRDHAATASRNELFLAAYKRFVREIAGDDIHRRCCALANAEIEQVGE